jgi:transposase
LVRLHGLDLGGEAGARHCRAEAVLVSARTVLRYLRQITLPEAGTVHVLGVDDWSRRRGQHYGTILVNLETHEVLDLLPDRTAETLAAWLVQHPEIEVISRDRAGAYAEGARSGAPQAIQVADRFHLDKNVTEALERYLLRQHRSLRQAAQAGEKEQAAPASPQPLPAVDLASEGPPAADAPEAGTVLPLVAPEPTTHAGRQARARRAWRLARYEEVVALHAQGRSARAIAAATGLSRATVQTFVQAGSFPERQARAPRRVQLTLFLPYLHDRWDSGAHNAVQLWRELRRQGYRGGRASVTRLLQTWRATPAKRTQAAGITSRPRPVPAAGYSPRTTGWLLLKEAATLAPAEQAYLARLYQVCPQIALAQALAREFQTIIRERDVPGLYSWLRGVRQSGISELISVANGIWRDRQAVEAALTHAESQGQTEGFVNKLKCIKRTGYGRSGIDLLRRRLLLAS